MPNFCSVQICFQIASASRVFKLCALKVKGLENFQAFAFCSKLRVIGGGGGGGVSVKIFNSFHHCIGKVCKVCTISFERPVNYLCVAWHVFPPKYEAWTHFNRPWTEYQCQGVVCTMLIIFTESVNRSTCLSVYLIITRLRNVNLLCFS